MIRSIEELKKHNVGILPIGTVVEVERYMESEVGPIERSGRSSIYHRTFTSKSFYRKKTGVIVGLKRVYVGYFEEEGGAYDAHVVILFRVRFGMFNTEVLIDPSHILTVSFIPHNCRSDFRLPIMERRAPKWTDQERQQQSQNALDMPRDSSTGRFQSTEIRVK